MEQVSPLAVLPQASYIEFQPNSDKEFDYKTVFNMEQQKANADYKRKQDQISNRIKIQGAVDRMLTDPTSPLAMAGENPWQIGVLDKIRTEVQPYLKEMEQLYSAETFDENAIMNTSNKLSNYLLGNVDFAKVIAQKNKYANYKKVANGTGFDPEEVAKFDTAYYNYKGDGDLDPLESFNPSAMKALDMAKVNANLKSIYELDQKHLLPNGYEGYTARSPETLRDQLRPIWEANKHAFIREGIDENTWFNTRIKEYYDNFDENGIRYTEAARKDLLEANGGGTGNTTKKSSDGKGSEPLVTKGPDGRAIVSNTVRNAPDGLAGGTEQYLNNPAIAPTQKLRNAVALKSEIDTQITDVKKRKQDFITKNGNLTSKWSAAVKQQWEDLNNEHKELGQNARFLDGMQKDLKNDEFYKSVEYQQYSKGGGSVTNQIAYGLGFVTKEEGKYLDGLKSELASGTGFGAAVMNQLKGEQFFMGLPQEVDKKIAYINKYKAEALKAGKSAKPFDDYIDFIRKGEDDAYYKYAERTGIGANATSSVSGFAFDPNDPDTRAITDKYNGQTGKVAVNNSKGIRYVDGTKYEGSDKEVVVTSTAMFDATTGTYVLRGIVGEPAMDDDKKREKDFKGDYVIDAPKEIIISDRNVNSELLHTFLYDTPGAANIAETLFPRLAKTVDVKDGMVTTYKVGNNSYKITKSGDGYNVSVNGSPAVEQANRLDLARFIANSEARFNQAEVAPSGQGNSQYYVPIYKDGQLLDPATNSVPTPTNTNGGGTGKKSLSQANPYMDLFKEMANKEETKGYSEQDSYIQINRTPQKNKKGETIDPTNALGRYQLLPTAQGDKIMAYIKKHPELLSKDQRYNTATNQRELAQKLGRYGEKQYGAEYINAYLHFLNNPELQDKFMMEVLLPEYKEIIPKVIEVYKREKGMDINEAQAIDMIHHNGRGNAQKGIGSPRTWAAKYNITAEQKEANKSVKSYTLRIQEGSGANIKKVNKNLISAVEYMIPTLGLENFGLVVSSGQRDWGADRDHPNGTAIDLVAGNNTPQRETTQLRIIKVIASKMADPKEAERVLLSGKDKVNGGEPLIVEVNGQMVKIIYHKNANSPGNHFHIELDK